MSDQSADGLYQYCLQPGCSFTESWNGGSAGEDPALPHLFMNPEHTVRGGASDKHKRYYQRQKSGELDVTREVVDNE